MTSKLALRFELHRDVDYVGVTGTGIVAHGVQWPDGIVSVRWSSDRPSIVHWNSIEDATAIHCHDGTTRIAWVDEIGTHSV